MLHLDLLSSVLLHAGIKSMDNTFRLIYLFIIQSIILFLNIKGWSLKLSDHLVPVLSTQEVTHP